MKPNSLTTLLLFMALASSRGSEIAEPEAPDRHAGEAPAEAHAAEVVFF